jgi:hypothetical protein
MPTEAFCAASPTAFSPNCRSSFTPERSTSAAHRIPDAAIPCAGLIRGVIPFAGFPSPSQKHRTSSASQEVVIGTAETWFVSIDRIDPLVHNFGRGHQPANY